MKKLFAPVPILWRDQGVKFIKFLFIGGVITLSNISGTFILTELCHIHYLLSYAITILFNVAIGFSTASRFIFKTRKQHARRLFLYGISLLIFYGTDIFFTWFLSEKFRFHYTLSILIARSINFLLKFFVYNRWLFRDDSFLFLNKKS